MVQNHSCYFLKWTCIVISLLFVTSMLIMPLVVVITEAFRGGWQLYVASLWEPYARDAIVLTLEAVSIAVICNTVFGISSAWLLSRYQFKGKVLINCLLIVPFAVSPVIAGLFFILAFGRTSPLFDLLGQWHISILFSVMGVVMATIFVTLPFITQELLPLLINLGSEEEEAALLMGASMGTIFRRITLPNIKWALLYGIVLTTARAMGEFGAVSVISGHLQGRTNTMPLYIEVLYNNYNFTAAFAVASLLVVFSVLILLFRNYFQWKVRR